MENFKILSNCDVLLFHMWLLRLWLILFTIGLYEMAWHSCWTFTLLWNYSQLINFQSKWAFRMCKFILEIKGLNEKFYWRYIQLLFFCIMWIEGRSRVGQEIYVDPLTGQVKWRQLVTHKYVKTTIIHEALDAIIYFFWVENHKWK